MKRRRPGGPPLDPPPNVRPGDRREARARAAERIGDALAAAPGGLRLSEVIERTGLPDLLALRGALELERRRAVRWAGGRLMLRGSRAEA